MTRKLIFAFTLLSTYSYAQPVSSTGHAACTGFVEPFFWGRLTDSRAEAMGQTVVTTSGNTNTSYYNPAGLGTLEGIQVSGTYATPYYSADNASFLYTSAAGKINDYVKVQFSRFGYRSNFELHVFDPSGNIIAVDEVVDAYTLGVASHPFKGWSFGANFKLLDISLLEGNRAKTLNIDVGVLKRFELAQKELHHTVDLGVNMMNVTGSDLNYTALGSNSKIDSPMNLMAGIAYSYSTVNSKVFDVLNVFGLQVQAEYFNQLDLETRHGYKTGIELAFLEMLYLRAGFYHRETCDHGYPEYNRGYIESLTYGAGLQVPLDKLTNVPLSINVDFAHLPQPSYVWAVDKEDPFTSANLHVTWML